VCMLRAKVRYFTTLHELAGSAEEEIEIDEGSVLADLIEEVASRYGREARHYLYYDDEKIDPSIYFLINGVNSKMLSGPRTELKDGDVVAIIPPIGGG
jgi:molybdopterin synthase sulfur carrier subunit